MIQLSVRRRLRAAVALVLATAMVPFLFVFYVVVYAARDLATAFRAALRLHVADDGRWTETIAEGGVVRRPVQ